MATPSNPYDPAYDDSYAPHERSGGVGCWLMGAVSLVVAALLVGVGLFLPPLNLYQRLFGVQYAALSPAANAIQHDALTLAVYGDDFGENFSAALDSTAFDAASGIAAPDWLAAARAAVPAALAPQSAIYTLYTDGTPPRELTLTLDMSDIAASRDLLGLYGWSAGDVTWRFIPAQIAGETLLTTVTNPPEHLALFQASPPIAPRVVIAVDVTRALTADAADAATIVAPAGLQPTLDGRLTGSLAAGFTLDAPYRVMPTIRNYLDARALDTATVTAIIADATRRTDHALQIAAFAAQGYDGVWLDYRGLPIAARDEYTAFVREVGRRMDEVGLSLGVVLPAARGTDIGWDTGAYDYRALGMAADIVQIDLDADPSAFAPGADRPIEALLRWATGEIDRDKLVIGLSALSTRQIALGSGAFDFTPIGYAQALSALGDVEIDAQTTDAGTVLPGSAFQARLDGFAVQIGTDGATGQPFIDYVEDDATVARIWLTTPDALRYRMDRAIPFALGGVAFTDLLDPGVAAGVYAAISAYKASVPAQADDNDLELRWTIQGADGVIGQVTTGLNDPLVATLDAPDGNYAVNVEVIEGGTSRAQRAGAALAVFAPTLTPTPLPTSTPTPTPAPTIPAPPQAVAAAANPIAPLQTGGGGAAVRPGAGSIAGGSFEYGGHVTSTSSDVAVGAMQRAGMRWMKEQIRYAPGMDGSVADPIVAAAHNRGFKVLIGIVGYPGDLAGGGAGYVAGFAAFAAGVAGTGPDAIEIWNEPNIDREWPTGMISGSLYADLLRQSYQAIKNTNGSVMVISAAPAPTGAEAAYPGQVMNDDRWLREVVAAGGMNYMDCVGAHYNEGIIAPSSRGGDPRDGYYTRYFFGMLDTYWSITGGARPICFTELGFLTPEGYGGLPDYFAWAQNVTLAQQSAWLAEAAALASQSGRVRLMIIWNVDFTVWGSDPMAGYAIIRGDGGCPACDALAGAR
ncbi:MAG: hypothetical protein SGI73_13430 [Chloroflexota bacterium]|nr:hypothetical protein [Chloroflexota bacterium]